MDENLNFPPTPTDAPQYAQFIVELAQQIANVNLDFSVASLEDVDDILGQMRKEGTKPEQVGLILWGFGCYVGEVFVRSDKGQWTSVDERVQQQLTGVPIVIQLPNGTMCNPIIKVFKRLENGREDNLPFFYHVFATQTLK